MQSCSVLLLNVYANVTCSRVKLHMLATDQKIKPAVLKANICHFNFRYHHKTLTVSWFICIDARYSKNPKQLLIGYHTSQ